MAKATTKNAAAEQQAEETVNTTANVEEVATEETGKGKGKGKKAAAPVEEEPTYTQLEAWMIPVKEIFVPEENMGRPAVGRKETKEEFEAFCETIALGIEKPLIVSIREDAGDSGQPYELIDGNRRLRAAKALKMKEVPVLIRTNKKINDLVAATIANMSSLQLSPIQKAAQLKKLVDAGMSQKKIASSIGQSAASVTLYLKLNDLSEETRKKVESGFYTFTAGLDMARIEAMNDPDLALEIKRRAEEKAAKEAQKLAAATGKFPKTEKPTANAGSGTGSSKGKQGAGTGRQSDSVQSRHINAAAADVAAANPKAAKALKDAGVLKKQTVDFSVVIETYFVGSGVPAREAFADLYKGLMNGDFDGEAFAETFDSVVVAGAAAV
jgi:ParB/RepB/Spo0J family partition protein